MLGQRRRRWPSIKTLLDQRLVFTGLQSLQKNKPFSAGDGFERY